PARPLPPPPRHPPARPASTQAAWPSSSRATWSASWSPPAACSGVGPPCDAAAMPRTSDFDRQALAALAAKQHGVLARAQALQSGMTERALDYRIRGAGPWQPLLPGVYLTHTGRPADEAREMAALLYAGPQSVLTGAAAQRPQTCRGGWGVKSSRGTTCGTARTRTGWPARSGPGTGRRS